MTLNPDGLTMLAAVLGLGGVVFGAIALIMKRKRDAIVRELDQLRQGRNTQTKPEPTEETSL